METTQRFGHMTLYGVDRDAKFLSNLRIALVLIATEHEDKSVAVGQLVDSFLHPVVQLAILHIARRALQLACQMEVGPQTVTILTHISLMLQIVLTLMAHGSTGVGVYIGNERQAVASFPQFHQHILNQVFSILTSYPGRCHLHQSWEKFRVELIKIHECRF